MKLSRSQFDGLALEHLDLLYRLARRITGNDADAQDLVQNTYARAFAARDSFDLQEFGIRPWMIRIMRNEHVSEARREKRAAVGIDPSDLDAARASQESAPTAFSFDLVDEKLAAAVQALPEEYQTPLLLWAIEELSYKEIAAACEVPIGTVMSRLHRARQQLAEKLGDFGMRKE